MLVMARMALDKREACDKMNNTEFANPWEEHKYHIGQIVNNASMGSWYWLKQRIRNGNTEGDDLIVAIKSKLEAQAKQDEKRCATCDSFRNNSCNLPTESRYECLGQDHLLWLERVI
jgi:uncharacterized iron-regulated protein